MRERIIEGFGQRAFKVGFHAATVDDLSAGTGISKRTIYRYFRSKDAIIMAVMDGFLAEAEKKIYAALASAENPVEKITRLIRVVSDHLKILNPIIINDMQKYYPHVWTHIESYRAQKAREIISILIAGNSQGYFRETIPEIFVTALLASIRDVLNPYFIIQNNLVPEEAAVCLFNMFMYGIVSDEARGSRPL